MTTTRQIPLMNRSGEAIAWATVDECDYERLSKHRWRFDPKGYAGRYAGTPGGRRYISMHRAILGLTFGDRVDVDHINGDGLDNRRSNLRVVTRAENLQNKRASRGSSSQYRGVRWITRVSKWRAEAQLHGKYYHLGYFSDEIQAALAASRWRSIHMPFAVQGQIQ